MLSSSLKREVIKKVSLGKVKYFPHQMNNKIAVILLVKKIFLICWQIEAFCDLLIDPHFKNIFSQNIL